MNLEHLISVDHFCTSHDIEITFVNSLHQYGLIQLVSIEEKPFIEVDKLPDLEKFVTYHYELEINLEGIETIVHLLGKIQELQLENRVLRNRVGLHE